jgi:hypothetical protein
MMKAAARRRPVRVVVSVFDGRFLAGTVRQLTPQRFEAVGRDGKTLGIFSNQRVAASILPRVAEETST